MKHQYKPKKCKFIEHRAVKFDRETGNPKLDADWTSFSNIKEGTIMP